MVTLDLVPHVGAGPLLLGCTRAQARDALLVLGFPLEFSRDALDYFCDASIQTESGSDDRITFIGFCCHQRFSVHYQGQNVFALPAPQVFALIAAAEVSGPHTYERYEYCFPDQIITLWDADEQYDRLGNESSPVWAQVGIADYRYVATTEAACGEVQ